METFNRALPSRGTSRNSQPETNRDIITAPILSKMPFVGDYSEDQIAASIRKTREEHKEIQFKPRNFGV